MGFLEQVQKNAARFVCCDCKSTTGTTALVKGLGRDTLENRRLLNQSALFYKFHNTRAAELGGRGGHCPPNNLVGGARPA